MDIEWPTADEWQAIWGALTFAVAVIAAIVALSQHRDSIRSRQEQTRPYVSVDYHFIAGTAVTIEVKNTGLTAAKDIRCAWSKPPIADSPRSQDAIDRALVNGRIPFLAPGRSIRFLVGAFDQSLEPRLTTVRSTYLGSGDNRTWESESVLDLDQWAQTLADRDPYESIVRPLKDLATAAARNRRFADPIGDAAESLRLYLEATPEVSAARRAEARRIKKRNRRVQEQLRGRGTTFASESEER